MSPTLTKIIVGIGVVITLGMLGLILYQQHELKTQQTAIQTSLTQQQQLVDGIMKSSSQYATTADLQNFANQNGLNLKAIQDNLNQLSAQLASINVISADSTGQKQSSLPSSGQGPANPTPPPSTTVACTPGGTATCPSTDPFGYQKAEQDFALNEDFGTLKVPFGTVGFSAWQQSPWNVNIPVRQYNVDTVVGVDENEKQTFYNKFSVNVNGKSYDIPITTATTKQQVPTASWSWWNPRLLMGLDGGININHVTGEFTPSINLGIMSYGQYKTTPDFSILEVGVGYGAINKTAEVVITPVSYNIGKKLFSPLMNNTYIGPSVQIGTDGSIGVGAGLRVGF
jgi:hypothetical protein